MKETICKYALTTEYIFNTVGTVSASFKDVAQAYPQNSNDSPSGHCSYDALLRGLTHKHNVSTSLGAFIPLPC